MSVVVLGNFDTEEGNINPDFQFTGTWYNYWTGDSIEVVNVNETITLQAGEYKLYTSVKLTKPALVGINLFDSDIYNNVLYPNPVSESLTITNTENVNDIYIYNLLGSIVYSNQYNNVSNIRIDTHKLTPGYYFVRMRTYQGVIISKKFIKK